MRSFLYHFLECFCNVLFCSYAQAGSGFFSDAHTREHDPSDTIQSPSTARSPKRSRTRDLTAASPPRGLASRAAAEPGQRSAGLSPWGAVTGGRTPRRTWRRERGWARRARSPGSRARPGRPGARRRARVLPPRGPGGGDPRPAGAARAQRRGRRGRPSRFRSIAGRLSQPAAVWPRLPPRPPGARPPTWDQGRVCLGSWARTTTGLPQGPSLASHCSVPRLCALTWAGGRRGGTLPPSPDCRSLLHRELSLLPQRFPNFTLI